MKKSIAFCNTARIIYTVYALLLVYLSPWNQPQTPEESAIITFLSIHLPRTSRTVSCVSGIHVFSIISSVVAQSAVLACVLLWSDARGPDVEISSFLM